MSGQLTYALESISVKFVLEQFFAGYLNAGSAEQSKCTGDGHDVAVILFFHPWQERFRHLLGEIRKVAAVSEAVKLIMGARNHKPLLKAQNLICILYVSTTFQKLKWNFCAFPYFDLVQ